MFGFRDVRIGGVWKCAAEDHQNPRTQVDRQSVHSGRTNVVCVSQNVAVQLPPDLCLFWPTSASSYPVSMPWSASSFGQKVRWHTRYGLIWITENESDFVKSWNNDGLDLTVFHDWPCHSLDVITSKIFITHDTWFLEIVYMKCFFFSENFKSNKDDLSYDFFPWSILMLGDRFGQRRQRNKFENWFFFYISTETKFQLDIPLISFN